MGHTKSLRIELAGGPNDGTLIHWMDTFPPSRWLMDIPGHEGRNRLRSVYRPQKTTDGNAYVVRSDGTYPYRYEGQEQT